MWNFFPFSFSVTSQDYLELQSVVGPVLERALRVVDSTTIKHYISLESPHHKGIFKVPAASGDGLSYTFYVDINFCPCPSFEYDTVQNKRQYTCKHQLAARIAKLLGKTKVIHLPETRFKRVLEKLSDESNSTQL